MQRDRSLLFGLFTARLLRVSSSESLDLVAYWSAESSIDLSERLVEAGAVTPRDRLIIDRLVDEAIAANGGDMQATLEAFGGAAQAFESIRALSANSGGPQASSDATIDWMLKNTVHEQPGRYAPVGEYARGGMGRILLVRDEYLGRDVALKELLPRNISEGSTVAIGESPAQISDAQVSRFLREARVTGQLEHPSIVPVYELGKRADGTLYYTMKLVRGRTLSDAIRACGSMRQRLELLPHFTDLCQAIAYAHSRSVIHRDIKPQNVMVGEFGETVVLDWGLAKVPGADESHGEVEPSGLRLVSTGERDADAPTVDGEVLGTPLYMAPEQARGTLDAVDERSDVYALGAVLYELLTGKPPHPGGEVRRSLNEVLAESRRPVDALAPDAPRELIAICDRAMSNRKSDRYPSASALADDVTRFQSGALVSAYEYKPSEHLRRYVQKHRTAFATLSAALLLIVSLSGYYFTSIARSNRELERSNAELAKSIEQENVARREAERALAAADAERVRADDRAAAAEYEQYVYSILYAQNRTAQDERPIVEAALLKTPEQFRHWEWGYLMARSRPDIIAGPGNVIADLFGPESAEISAAEHWRSAAPVETQRYLGHEDSVLCVQFSPDGKYVLSTSADDTAVLWDVGSGDEFTRFRGHTGNVVRGSFCLDGEWVLTASEDGTARLWDTRSGLELKVFEGHSDRVFSAVMNASNDAVLTASWDGTARLWSLADAETIRVYKGHTGAVWNASFSPDGARVATAAADRTLRIWDTETANELLQIAAHDDYVSDVEFSPDGKFLLSSSSDKTTRIWDAYTGDPVRTISGHGSFVVTSRYSYQGDALLTSSWDKSVGIWDATSGDRLATILGHTDGVNFATFSPDGKTIATASADHTVRIWKAEHRIRTEALAGHLEPAIYITCSPDSKRIGSASWDRTACIWSSETGELMHCLEGHTGLVKTIDFSPESNRVVTASWDGTARIWDLSRDGNTLLLAGHTAEVLGAHFDASGDRVLTFSWDKTARIWDSHTGEELIRLQVGGDDSTRIPFDPQHLVVRLNWFIQADFSPDDARVVTASFENEARVWDADSGERLMTLKGHTAFVYHAEFSPDGRFIVTCSGDNSVRIWDARDGSTVSVMKGFVPYSPHFSPSCDKLAVAWLNGSPEVFDVKSGDTLYALDGHVEGVMSVRFSPDGTRILTASNDTTAKLWDAGNGRELLTLNRSKPIDLNMGQFSPDGHQIVTAGGDGFCWVYRAVLWDDLEKLGDGSMPFDERVRAWAKQNHRGAP